MRAIVVFCLLLAACGAPASEEGSSAEATGVAGGDAPAATYVLAPSSRFDVHTDKAGLFGVFAHRHHIRAGAFEGTIRYDPGDLSGSSVRVVVPLDRLEILTDADADDREEIREAMEEEVLEVARHSELTFVSRAVAASETGIRVTGDLTLHGTTRPQVVYMALEVSGDTLRASGAFSVRQTDFGMKPYRAAAGTIAVADEIRFDLEAVAVRESGME